MPVMFTEVWKCSEESLNKVEQIGPYWHYCLSNFNYSFSILRSPSQWNEAEDRLLVGFLAELNSTPSLVRMVQSLTVNFVKGAWKKPPRPVVWNQFVFIASINFCLFLPVSFCFYLFPPELYGIFRCTYIQFKHDTMECILASIEIFILPCVCENHRHIIF